jgi:nucleoid-associated protein YgaU
MFDRPLDIERPFGQDRPMHRTYVRRRIVVTALAAALAAGTVAPVARALARPSLAAVSQRSYVVRPGDTLWSVAARVAPGSDPRPLVQRIERANGIDPGQIVPGERLVIPSAPPSG